MSIAPASMVNIYADIVAVLLLAGLLVIPRGTDRKDAATGIFVSMILGVIILALANTLRSAMYGLPYSWAVPTAFAAQSVSELASLFTVYQWILYVDYKLYGSRDHLRRRFPVFFIPIVLLALAVLVNGATGFLFRMGDDASFEPAMFYYIMVGIEFFYLLMAALFMAIYVVRGGKKRFFSTVPVIIPVVIGAAVSLATDYSVRGLGLAVGLVYMYFYMADGWRYGDRSSGFYNKKYLSFLEKEGSEYLGAVCFKASGEASELESIIKNELPKESIIIRYDKSRYLFFTGTDREEEIRFLADLVMGAADAHDKRCAHEKAVKLTYSFFTRSREQDIKELFYKAVNG